MIKSAISEQHHYYLMLFELPATKAFEDVLKIVGYGGPHDELTLGYFELSEKIFHVQREINFAYGSPLLLERNKSRKAGEPPSYSSFYWYDFYVGGVNLNSLTYGYICYPYKALQKILETSLKKQLGPITFLIPDVGVVLDYMRTRKNLEENSKVIQSRSMLIDITKYSAEISDEGKTDRVHLVGRDPINSDVYKVLVESDMLTIRASALVLHCWGDQMGEIFLNFDRLGNYRFWIPKNGRERVLSVLSYVFGFLGDIGALKDTYDLSTYTTLSDGGENE